MESQRKQPRIVKSQNQQKQERSQRQKSLQKQKPQERQLQKRKFQPREKSDLIGFESLTEEELLSLILGHGDKSVSVYEIASKIVRVFHSYISGERTLNEIETEILAIKGIGYSKAKSLLAVIELSKRLYSQKEFVFNSPEKVVAMCLQLRKSKQEKVMSIFLNSNMQLVFRKQSFCGTVDKTLISPREIFLAALKVKARYIVIAHNHPSGNSQPSDQDLIETKKIKEIGETLGIHLLDHIIVTRNTYLSFKERGIL